MEKELTNVSKGLEEMIDLLGKVTGDKEKAQRWLEAVKAIDHNDTKFTTVQGPDGEIEILSSYVPIFEELRKDYNECVLKIHSAQQQIEMTLNLVGMAEDIASTRQQMLTEEERKSSKKLKKNDKKKKKNKSEDIPKSKIFAHNDECDCDNCDKPCPGNPKFSGKFTGKNITVAKMEVAYVMPINFSAIDFQSGVNLPDEYDIENGIYIESLRERTALFAIYNGGVFNVNLEKGLIPVEPTHEESILLIQTQGREEDMREAIREIE